MTALTARAPGGRVRRLTPMALSLVALLAPSPGWTADPFYLKLLRDGDEAYEQRNYAAASHDLEIACFGLLDEPTLLAQCLVSLALAHAATTDIEAFERDFRRIVEIESRFGAYAAADLPEGRRSAFEIAIARYIPKKELALLPEFEALAERAALDRLSQLPARERRPAIEARLRERPDDPLYLLLLAQLETAEGRSRRAIDALDALLKTDPAHAVGRCLRGRLLAADRQCSEALPDLPGCADQPEEREGKILELGCLIRERRWESAGALLDGLSEDALADPEIARLAPRVERELELLAEQAAAAAARSEAIRATAESPGVAADDVAGEGASPAPAAPVSPEAELAALRQSMTRVTSLEDLVPIAARAWTLAEEYPEVAEAQFLAGEAAYLARRWDEAAAFFRRAGNPPAGRSLLRFYMAVSYFESGDTATAAQLLEGALPGLERTPFVQGYIDRILGQAADG